MSKQTKLAWLALTAVLGIGIVAQAAVVDQDTAMSAASGFLSNSSVAKRVLVGRSVESVEQRGSLWIVHLAPSGYIEVAGSTKCAPILSFSSYDFAEPEVGSPLVAKLSADNLMIEKKEADESLEDNADWAKYTAPVTKKRMLLAARPTGTDSTGYDPYVAPLLGATWHQTAPYNDLSPYNYFCGCMATAAGQELRYWRWPYRCESFRSSAHGVRDAQNNYHTLNLHLNGLVPFDWDKIKANYTDESNASTPWANDKQSTYNAAYLTLWAQSLTGMGYKPGGSGGTQQLASNAEIFGYEKGRVYTYWGDGYDALWAAIKADLDWGSPIQINTAAHQMVIDGYAVENVGTENEIDWINLNLGYGQATYWDNLKTAVTEGTYSGKLAAFQTGYRPQKIVQFEPVPKVSGTELELAWHLPPCYTNRISGFLLQTKKDGNTVGGGGVIPSAGDTTTRYTYIATSLEIGGEYTFTVTPIMSDASEARANSVTTTIGEPKDAPEFLKVSSVACGIELLQQDIFIECAYGQVNDIKVTCSESTTSLTNYSSHTTIIPDNKISVTKNGNVFTVSVDATDLLDRWNVDGEMILLTMVAQNDDGTEAYKNLMLRFNSMRQVINGTFDAAEGDSNSPVWFCGDTTIDAKGRAVSFGASAFQGTGKVTLTDSTGNGSFTFAGLDNFKGTLVFSGDVDVTLPSDMTKFEGTLSITSGTYTLSNDLPASVSVTIANGVTLNLDNANVASTITGAGTISITSGSSVLSGAVTSGVTLSGGELTIPAGTGDYSTVSVGGGTLKIQLTQAQSILGYDWWLPLYTSGSVKFVLYDGTEVNATTTAATPGIRISLASDANVWSGTDYATFGENYSAKWSNGLPSEGDYVIFKSELNDYMETGTDEGTMMVLNLTSPRNLGYVLVKGTDKLEIGVYSGATSALLSTDVLENEVETHITTTYFQPKAVIPHKKLSTSSGFILSCELDSAYADNLKKHETGGSALPDANYWQGTVVFCNKNVNNLELPNYGNAQSKIRFNGVTGSLLGGKVFDGTLELVDYGESPALNINAGSTEYSVTIGSVVGNGTFKISGETSKMNLLLKDISGWTGSFDLASKTVAIGQTVPSDYTGADGRLHICQAATVADGATWKAAGGLYLGAGGALTINGAVEAKNITTYGTGASITLEDDSVLQVSAASANDQTPTLNFKAGTFRVEEGSDAFRETATINFCAGSGKRTVIDANGATLTLGPNVFSGSGDVYLTSSKEGGKIIVEGVSADYSGTIYCDISCEVSLGDLSKATDCTIDVSDIIISRSSSDIGNFTIGAGASLEVTVSKAHLISGLEIDSVTLVDGGTLVLRDKDGKELEYTTSGGKYILEADSSVTAECLLDYEFNGNAASTGSDNNATLSASSTITYYDSSALYTKCTPWINKEFAMPDDEWTSVIRGTLPAASSEKPTIVIMFGANGGNIFGLVAGTEENTVALADRSGIIGSAVAVDDATTKYHVYTIVKTASRVRLYVDGVLKVDEARVVSIPKKFQIGSVHGSNNSSYASCTGDESRLDYLKFYDFAVGEDFEEMVYSGPKPIAVWDGDFRASELIKFNGYVLVDEQETHGENGSSVTIDQANEGLMFRSSTGLSGMTVLVRYSNLTAGTTKKRVLFTSTINSNYTGTRAGIRLASGTDGTLRGLSGNTDWDDSRNSESGSVDSSGVMAFTYSSAGTYLYKGSSLDDMTEAWGCSSLKWASDFSNAIVYGAGIGGYCEGASATGYEAAQGMTITAIAVFDSALTASVLQDYRWPSDEPEEPEITFEVSPESGEVAYGTEMTITCDDPTATIWYKEAADSDYMVYTGPVVLSEPGLKQYSVKVNDGEPKPVVYMVSDPEPEPEPDYNGPDPIAVWVAGEFGDDKSAHGGLEFTLNGNTIDANGNIVIGSSTTLGATATLPDATYQKVTMLVQYSLPSGGAPAANSVPASLFSTYDLGALAASGSSALEGYWYTGSAVSAGGNYPFSNPAQTIPQDGYILISTWAANENPDDHGTAVYTGESLSSLSGGEKTNLRFTGADHYITSVGIGGPTVAGAVPWVGMVIKSVALFDEWVSPSVLANYTFPEQGAVQPEDSDRYVVDPVASWVNDFKTIEKNGCTLSVSGTTAVKDDAFGGTLTIGDAAAVVDVRNGANGGNLTVLVKYRATPTTVNAPVVTFGETLSNSVKIDVGAYTQSARTLAVNRSYSGGNSKWVALNTAASLNEGEGYLLCARKSNDMLVYVGNSLDSMTGGSTAAPGDISYSCDLIQAVGIGGPSGLPNADSTWSPFTGFVVEKVVVFNGYYTPDQIRYIPNPEDSDTVNIADNTTWTFTASDTPREYTSVGTLSSSGTIAIANASELSEGTYPLATWTTPQKKSTGYGHVGNLDVTGLPAGLSAELVYGAKAIYLRVWNPKTQAAKGTIKVWPYGDSITEGFNAGGTRANYRVLLAQKLSMLGFNVEMVGCYDKINGADAIDPAGQIVPDAWKWHSAKHGATAGPTGSAAGRANLCENVDTLCAQAGNPDVVLLLAGANDIVPATGRSAQQVVNSITNIVAHIAMNLPDTKIVVGNQINVEQGYNSGNYNHVVERIPEVNSLLKAYVDNLPTELTGRVFLADLNSYVKSGEYGILFDHVSDHLHPDWWGHDQMAEGWLSVITNQFTATQVFPSATVPAAPTTEELGAAAKTELEAYRQGFKLARRIDAASNLDTTAPYAFSGTGATEGIEKVGYFVEYVRADNHAHKWVWVDMDAFGTTIGEVGLPTANHQQAVTKLHVKSNHNGIDDIAADDDTVTGFIEFSPYNYTGDVSGVNGAPTGNASCCDWNDTLSTSGSYGCMQVHRVFSPAKSAADGVARGGQVLFAYNNWQSSSSTAEFGIGNFSSHFYRGANDAQTLDYTYTANASKMNAAAYSVKRIEIWTKVAEVPAVVAQIGEESYASLAEALQTVTGDNPVAIMLVSASGENVTLPSNVTVTENSAGLYTGTLSGSGTLVLAGTRTSAMQFGEWTGTVVLPQFQANGQVLTNYCNDNSKLKLNGITGGYLHWTDFSLNAEVILAGNFVLTDMSQRNYAFNKISGSGNISLSPGTYELTGFTIGELAEGYAGAITNNMNNTKIVITNLMLPANTSVTPGSKVLAIGGSQAEGVTVTNVKVGGVLQNVQLERRNQGQEGDGLYVKMQIDDQGEGADQVITVITEPEQESVAVPVDGGFAGTIVVAPTVKTIDTGNVAVQSSQVQVKYGTTEITGAFTVGNDLSIALNAGGVVEGVSVDPAIDTTAEAPVDMDAATPTIKVKAIPGLWYAVKSGTALGNEGVDGDTATSTPALCTALGTIKLTAPAKNGEDTMFYSIMVSTTESELSGN